MGFWSKLLSRLQAFVIPPTPQISHLNPLHCSKHFPPLLAVAEFEEPDPLPGTEREVAVGDRHTDRGPDERGFNMCLCGNIS